MGASFLIGRQGRRHLGFYRFGLVDDSNDHNVVVLFVVDDCCALQRFHLAFQILHAANDHTVTGFINVYGTVSFADGERIVIEIEYITGIVGRIKFEYCSESVFIVTDFNC